MIAHEATFITRFAEATDEQQGKAINNMAKCLMDASGSEDVFEYQVHEIVDYLDNDGKMLVERLHAYLIAKPK